MAESSPKKVEIVIPRVGGARAILSSDTAAVLGALGTTEAKRASHIEPAAGLAAAAREWLKTHPRMPQDATSEQHTTRDADGIITHVCKRIVLYADLTPVNGPVLGPFLDRTIAVDEEIAWLRSRGFPVPGDPNPPTNG